MKKRYFMKTENDITTVYEYFEVEPGEIIPGMTFGEYMRQKQNGKPIATFTNEWRAEKFINEMRNKTE